MSIKEIANHIKNMEARTGNDSGNRSLTTSSSPSDKDKEVPTSGAQRIAWTGIKNTSATAQVRKTTTSSSLRFLTQGITKWLKPTDPTSVSTRMSGKKRERSPSPVQRRVNRSQNFTAPSVDGDTAPDAKGPTITSTPIRRSQSPGLHADSSLTMGSANEPALKGQELNDTLTNLLALEEETLTLEAICVSDSESPTRWHSLESKTDLLNNTTSCKKLLLDNISKLDSSDTITVEISKYIITIENSNNLFTQKEAQINDYVSNSVSLTIPKGIENTARQCRTKLDPSKGSLKRENPLHSSR